MSTETHYVLALRVVLCSSVNLEVDISSSHWSWIRNTTEIKRKLSKYGKTDSSLRQYFHINLWMTKIRVIFSFSLLVTCIRISHISGLEMLVSMTNKEFGKYYDIPKLNFPIEK